MYYYRENELYHHGIMGMHWGDRNGPPYPLNYNSHSSTEKRQNTKASLSAYTDSNGQQSLKRYKKTAEVTKKNTKDIRDIENNAAEKLDQQAKDHMRGRVSEIIHSKKFKIAMGIAIGAIAVYGATKLGKAAIRKYAINNIVKPEYNKLPRNFGSLKHVPKARRDYYKEFFSSTDPDAWKNLTQGINHGINESNIIIDALGEGGRNQNCTFCSAAIIMRLKGYRVTAAKTNIGVVHEITDKWFTNVKMKKPKTSSAKKLYNILLKQGDGSYGTLNVFWKNGPGGHSIVYAVKNGAVEIIDGQLDKSYGNTIEALTENLFKNCDLKKTELFNLTNCDPTEAILKAIMR